MNIHRVMAIIRKEFIHIIRDPRSLGMAIAMPILLIFLFGSSLSLDVDNVPLVVWDQSGTSDSREFVGRFTAPAPIARGGRVVVRGPRGVEVGVVLCEPGEKFAPALSTEGALLRTATADDESRVATFAEREATLLALAGAAFARQEAGEVEPIGRQP
jgi:hypothetical protein